MASTLELLLLAALNQRPQLIQKQVLTSTQATVTFPSIPQNFTNLRLTVSAKSDGTGASGYDSGGVQFNGVTSGYNWNTFWATQGGTAVSTTSGTSQGFIQCLEIWNSHFGTAGRGIATINIPNYSDSSNVKNLLAQSIATDGGAAGILQTYGGSGGLTSAITSITVLMGTGNFVADSTFCLYGE